LYCERAEILKKVIEQRQKSNPVKKSLPVATPVSAPGSSRKIAQISPHSPRVAIPSRSVPSSSLSIPYPISDAPSRAENARGILTHSQKLHFIKNGFVIIRNVIPPDICEKCIDYIEEGQRFFFIVGGALIITIHMRGSQRRGPNIHGQDFVKCHVTHLLVFMILKAFVDLIAFEGLHMGR